MKLTHVLVLLSFAATGTAKDVYVNKVWPLGDNQFYVYLRYNEGFDWRSHEEIAPYLGPATGREFESTRRTLPLDVAKKYFKLPWQSELWLFDNATYTNLTALKFLGVEYLDEMISTSYVAVFEAEGFLVPESRADLDYYCISSSSEAYLKANFAPAKVAPQSFDGELKEKYSFSDKRKLKIQSIEYQNSTLTLCSFLGENYDNNSVIMKSAGQDHSILLAILRDRYVMWEMILTPLFIESMPVIIMEMGVPETDQNWTEIAVFNGTNYVLQFPDEMVAIK